jgi:sugar/nucleoside kinase (ribokinase family)
VIIGVVGSLTLDHLVRVGQGAHFNSLGGPGLYAALGARLVAGTEVRLSAGLPASTPAFANSLNEAGIDLSFCNRVDEPPRLWILDSPEGRRVVTTSSVQAPEIARYDDKALGTWPDDPSFTDGLDGVLLCAPDRIGNEVHRNTLVGVDPDQEAAHEFGWDYWRAIARPGGVLLPSRVQLRALGGDPRSAAAKLACELTVAVVARLDTEGVFAVTPEGRCWAVEDAGVTVVDTTGAGDAMAGATVAAMAAGIDLPQAAALGVSVARLALRDWGHMGLLMHSAITAPLDGVHMTREFR